ncbi:MAG: FtsX-like permease family protein [Planctomycetes bacterium]|nr:FtsX-like permease family protein [Planctomycetota bacterium]
MGALLRFLCARHAGKHRLRTVLCILTIALGVALYVSMETAQASTLHAFEQAHKKLTGKAEWTITRGRGLGVEDEVLEILEDMSGLRAAPVLEQSAALPDLPEEGRLFVMGVDFRAEAKLRGLDAGTQSVDFHPLTFLAAPDSIVIAAAFARRCGLRAGSSLRLATPTGVRALRVAAVLEDRGAASLLGGRIAFLRYERAQEMFARGRRLDRIDVISTSGDDPSLGSRIQSQLGAGYSVERVKPTNKTLHNLINNMRSLVVLSVIGLMVGLFIVYLSVSIGVVERARTVGILRAVGATRRQILTVFLLEAAILGAAGSALGVALGYALAHATLSAVSKTMNLLLSLVELEEVILPGEAAVGAFIAGTATAILAGFLPARRAATISPLSALRPAMLGAGSLPSYGRAAAAGLALFITAFVLVVLPPSLVPARVSLGGTAALFLGVALMMPQVTILASRALRAPLRAAFSARGFLAADNVLRYPQRSSLTAVAFGGALAVLVTSTAVIGALQKQTDVWLRRSLPFDLSVQPAQLSSTVYSNAALPEALPAKIAALPETQVVYGVKLQIQEWRDHDVMLLALDWEGYEATVRHRGFELGEMGVRSEGAMGEAMAALRRGEAFAVSKNFANLYGVPVGQSLTMKAPGGDVTMPVVLEIEDYSWPQGVVFLSLPRYRELWADRTLTYVDVLLRPGTELPAGRRAISSALGDEYGSFLYSGDEIREYGQAMVDQSFSMLHAQVIVAMAIGFLGIVNTLLISVLQRTREIGLLRVVGMTRGELSQTVVLESLFVALVGGLFGIAAGLFAAEFSGASHMMRLTGHELPFHIPWGSIGFVGLASVVLGLVASVLPARRAAGQNVLEAIGYE